MRHGVKYPIYLVKWHSAPLWDASWELESDILHIDPTSADLLRKYNDVYWQGAQAGVDLHLDTFSSDSDE
eukprot:jgi/Chrzof1/15032/Cz09g24190.t1